MMIMMMIMIMIMVIVLVTYKHFSIYIIIYQLHDNFISW